MTAGELIARLMDADLNAEVTIYVDDDSDPGFQFGFAVREVNVGWTTEAHDARAPRGNLVGIVAEGGIA